jgi:hypothetical protein
MSHVHIKIQESTGLLTFAEQSPLINSGSANCWFQVSAVCICIRFQQTVDFVYNFSLLSFSYTWEQIGSLRKFSTSHIAITVGLLAKHFAPYIYFSSCHGLASKSRPFTADSLVGSQHHLCGICANKLVLLHDFMRVRRIYAVSIIPSILQTHSVIHHQRCMNSGINSVITNILLRKWEPNKPFPKLIRF